MGKEHRLVVLGAPGVGKSGKHAIMSVTSARYVGLIYSV